MPRKRRAEASFDVDVAVGRLLDLLVEEGVACDQRLEECRRTKDPQQRAGLLHSIACDHAALHALPGTGDNPPHCTLPRCRLMAVSGALLELADFLAEAGGLTHRTAGALAALRAALGSTSVIETFLTRCEDRRLDEHTAVVASSVRILLRYELPSAVAALREVETHVRGLLGSTELRQPSWEKPSQALLAALHQQLHPAFSLAEIAQLRLDGPKQAKKVDDKDVDRVRKRIASATKSSGDRSFRAHMRDDELPRPKKRV